MKKSNKKNITKILCILTSLCILITLYNKKKSTKSNIFSDNSVSISKEEVNNICRLLEIMLEIDIPEEENDEYLVINSIRENEAFGKSKRWFCEQVINIVKDNPYLNKEKVYKSLLNVEIDYGRNYGQVNDDIQGRYNYFFNDIDVYSGYPSLEVTFHEVIHCIFNDFNTQRLPRFFKEGMTELLANEYSSSSNNPFKETKTYPFEIAAVKMLCELSTPDAVLKAFTLGDMNYIVKEISKDTDEQKEVKKAINVLGEAVDAFQDEENYDLTKFNKDCIKIFGKHIDKKYDYNDPSSISYYYNEMLFYNCLFKEGAANNLNRDIDLYGIDYKAYFSNELKKKIKTGYYNDTKEEKDVQKTFSLYD